MRSLPSSWKHPSETGSVPVGDSVACPIVVRTSASNHAIIKREGRLNRSMKHKAGIGRMRMMNVKVPIELGVVKRAYLIVFQKSTILLLWK